MISVIDNDSGGVKSAVRVLQVLEHFAATRRPALAAELREHLDLPKSSCFALMDTLRNAGYVYWVGRDAGYYPTRKWFDLSRIVAEHDPVLLVVEPHLAAVRDATGETAILAKLDGLRVLYLAAAESHQVVRFSAGAGEHRPVHPASSGRALLGALPREEREALIARLPLTRFTSATCTDPRKLNALVERENAQGWHVNLGQHAPDTASVAVAFSFGLEHYALVVGAPLHRLKGRIPKVAKELIAHAREISRHDEPPS
ncbi:MAG: IclR family transcriptional regulator [Burkholderiaceae bacterium]